MTKRCLTCDFRTDEPADVCPACRKPLVPTLLPPEGAVAAEPEPAAERRLAHYPLGSGEPPRGLFDGLLDNGITWVALFVLVLALGWAAYDWSTSAPTPPTAAADPGGATPPTPVAGE
jgi:hypothetical protein